MLHRILFAALAFATLAIAQAAVGHAQAELPPGALVRLGTLNFLGGSSAVAMAFSPDGKTIVWQDPRYTVRHWDLATAKELSRFDGDDWGDYPQRFAVFQMIDDHTLLHSSANGLAVLDLSTGKERVVTEVARGKPSWISPDGRRVLTYSRRGSWTKRTAAATFTLWDVERSDKIGDFTHAFRDAPKEADASANLADVAFTPDGKTFAASWVYLASGPMLTYRVGQVISLWDVASGKERSLPAEAAFNLQFLDGGKTLACADGRRAGGARSTADRHHGTMEIWDVAANKRLHKFESAVDWSGPLAFSPDGKIFASSGGEDVEGADENAVAVWSAATGKQLKKFTGHHAQVRLLAFSPDGRMLASGTDDTLYKENADARSLAESILVWDVEELR
jgi:WD40 repeat protein